MASTDIVLSKDSPREKRTSNWGDYFVHKYDVSHGLKSQSDFEELKAFFLARRGGAYSFRFKDYGDYAVSNQSCAGSVVKLSSTTLQLKKLYATGLAGDDAYLERLITKPVDGTVVVVVNDVTRNISVDHLTGIVTITSDDPLADADTVKLSFEFDVPVRFDISDEWQKMSYECYKVYSWDSILLVEDMAETIIE